MTAPSARQRRRGRRAAALVPALLIALVLPPSLAAAAPARYMLEKCDSELPGGSVAGATFHGSPPFSGAQNCAESGGSIFVVQQGDANGGFGYWSLPLPAPPGGSVETVTVTGSMCNGAYGDAGTVAFAVAAGWAINCATQTHSFAVNSPAGSPGLIYLGCEGQCLGAPEVWAGGLVAVEVDPVRPRVLGLDGTLLAGGELHGHQSIDATAEDEGGGVTSLVLRVNGDVIEPPRRFPCETFQVANPSYVGAVVTRPTPCPAKAEASWTLDTSKSPFNEGLNSVSVCAQDLATIGSPNEGCLARNVEVDNSCPDSGVAGSAALGASFTASGGDRITVPFGRGAEVAGQLTDGGGGPIAGATICLATRVLAPRLPWEKVGTITTDADGHFSYRLSPGPGRTVVLNYRRDAQEIETTLHYRAHARPTLRSSTRKLRNGQSLSFAGRLNGPRGGGRVVILQAGAVGSKRWITFRRATTDAGGHFRASYRFTSTGRPTSYRFRALVPEQAGYPWAQGHSRPLTVRVAP
jgi:hypothetical protein